MLSHFPRLTMAQPAGLSARTASKFGGQPWGFPAPLWPVCAECGCPMSFLAQFAPGPQVPRIGAAHSLYVFTCERESVCSAWDPVGGANACVHVPHAQMHETLTPVPAGGTAEPAFRLVGSGAPPQADSEQSPVLLELWVSGWQAEDDSVPPELEPQFYDQRYFDLPEAIQPPHGFDSQYNTKAGGVPYWTGNGVAAVPDEPGRLLLQIDCWLSPDMGALQGADAAAALTAHAEATATPDSYWVAEDGSGVTIANFCSDGVGYVMDKTPDADEPSFYFMILR